MMTRRLSILAAGAVAVAGCWEETSPPGKRGGAVTSLRQIAGPWDIVSFAGYRPTRLHEGTRHAFVDVGADRLSYTIECNYSGNAARIDSSGILHDEDGGSRTKTLMGCAAEAQTRENAFLRFFSLNPEVRWMRNGRVLMASGRTELILERPEVRRLANVPPLREIAGRWVPQMAIRLTPANGQSGWGFESPGVVTITRDAVSYSGCDGGAFEFRYTADARMVTAGSAKADCGADTPGLMLLRVLGNDPLVERMAGGGIALTSGDEVVTLQRP